MANSVRQNTGLLPRLLQLSLDKIVDQENRDVQGVGDIIFQPVEAEKGFWESVQVASMGLATLKGEGAPVHVDTINQDWNYIWTILTIAQGARITMEAIQDNKYEDMLPRMGREVAKALRNARDLAQANVFNSLSSTAGPDGQNYASTAHPIQAGGTTSNLISPGLSMSENAIEQMVILADQMLNPNGQPGDYQTENLVVPVQLRFTADRLVNSVYRTNSADNDISAIYNQNVIKRVIPWKRLTSATAYMITTDVDEDTGFVIARKKGITTDSFKEPTTMDVIVTAYERYINFLADFRGVIYNAGA